MAPVGGGEVTEWSVPLVRSVPALRRCHRPPVRRRSHLPPPARRRANAGTGPFTLTPQALYASFLTLTYRDHLGKGCYSRELSLSGPYRDRLPTGAIVRRAGAGEEALWPSTVGTAAGNRTDHRVRSRHGAGGRCRRAVPPAAAERQCARSDWVHAQSCRREGVKKRRLPVTSRNNPVFL